MDTFLIRKGFFDEQLLATIPRDLLSIIYIFIYVFLHGFSIASFSFGFINNYYYILQL